ncbi:hypothetical protein DFH05DRAFT_1559725 [Lentinula detonsa]|uniref:F-box domain-containing protein n=1 Tax=Lentinula detonsa TaxID=2804962 RepID=A0A9W8NTI6_9AGAR|nr:hypothetical protein DFH05DRAFT_1559725 [Lentinula detonsa]
MYPINLVTILSLPNEIQLEILHALNDSNETKISKQETLRAVSQVCSRWRILSLSTSVFWTYIFICETSVDLGINFDDPYTVDETHAFRTFPWVSTLLHRSGSQPIDVSIDLQSEAFNPAFPEAENQSNFSWHPSHAVILSRILAAQATRLRTVEILSEVWQPIQGLAAALVDVPMPLLQTWTVTRDNAQWGHQLYSDLDIDADSMSAIECTPGIQPSAELSSRMYPNLRVLTLQGVPQHWNQVIPRNLVELDLEYLPVNRRPNYEELKNLLLGSQFSLQSLTLWAAAPLGEGRGKINLPNLKTLSLGFSFLNAAIGLTTHLELPSLRTLEIYDMTHQNPFNFDDEYDVRRTFLLLEDFYWHMIDHWPLRQITSLTLRSPSFNLLEYDELDEAFAGHREIDAPLPMLITFLMHCSSLKNLHLIDPDSSSFRALVTVSPVDHQNVPGPILVCSSLDLLHIEITKGNQSIHLAEVFSPTKYWAGGQRVAPRAIGTIALDVPSGWGTILRSALSDINLAQKILLNEDKRLGQ